jgi:RNA polymerase sigma factor for flagellar operon FliA
MAGQPVHQDKEEYPSAPSLAGMEPHGREKLIKSFLPFIKYQALRVASRLPNNVDAGDLMHAGVLGLLDAIKKYDPSKGTHLKTYAEFRIRGAILDELRVMDWASRSTREKMKRLEEAYDHLERELHRPPSEEEVAQSLDLEMEAFHNLVLETRGVGLISIEDLISFEVKDNTKWAGKEDKTDPHESYEWKEWRSKILEALKELSERDQLVLTLYYHEELTMKEIGLALGVTESRVSQVHAQALLKLKRILKNLG